MKLEQQVVSLELAQKLKELGVKQESLFVHVEWRDKASGRDVIDTEMYELDRTSKSGREFKNPVSAFTVAELGEMFPGNDGQCYYTSQKGLMGKMFYCNRVEMMDNKVIKCFEADTEADARAKMLIYLVENNLITL